MCFDNQSNNLIKFTATLIIITTIGFYFYTLAQRSVNIPYKDDFDLLNFSNNVLTEKSFQEKYHLLFKFNNEHRPVISRLVIYLMLKLFSKVNFKIAIFFGNLFLVGLLVLFYFFISINSNKLIPLTISTLLLFHLQHWENFYCAIGSLMNFGTVLFAGLAFYFLNRTDWVGFGISSVFAAISICSNGVGIIVFVSIGICYLLILKLKFFKFWFVISVISIFLYFTDYVKPEHHPSILEAIQHPIQLFLYLISFLGGIFSLDNHFFAPLAPFGGIGALIFFYFLTKKKYYLKNPGIYTFLLFIILVGLAASISRSPFGLHQAFSSRYKIYSTIFLILSFLAVFEFIPIKNRNFQVFFFSCCFLFSIFINLFSFPRNSYLLNVQTKIMTFKIRNWVMQKEGVKIKTINMDDEVMVKVLKTGIYRFSCKEVVLRKQDQAKWCP